MNRMMSRKWIAGVAIILVLTGVSLRIFFPPWHDLSKALPEGNFTPEELFHEFARHPADTYRQFGGKVILVDGVVRAANKKFVILGPENSPVKCILRRTVYDGKIDIRTGDHVVVKGVCEGLNMTEVVVLHAIILNRQEP